MAHVLASQRPYTGLHIVLNSTLHSILTGRIDVVALTLGQ
jgi:hypothetical protein